ncbi:zinc-binding dehydrogenase [Actinomadura sp. WMMA1423]|uniref:alcohol dehydrogenase catalytic domain-containing protein n=1 Tax=Actinomadura sp. WMMA1423 TaxID=2591108 RepID=UPI00143D7C08|nr:zinc-binding dehydrogenase [Actinomadura sp. WMMA1423]
MNQSPPAVMRAQVLGAFGEPLRPSELPVPSPGPGEVLVRIAAAGLNPLDVKIAAGAAAHARVRPPAVLGLDASGVVTALGPQAAGFAVGDEVYGMIGGVGGVQGSLAEYAAVDASLLAHKPAEWTMEEAAAVPLAIITAWEGLVDRAQVSGGDTVLVHGGAGGVGHLAVQLAVARGARVWATGHADQAATLRGLGAVPIDFERSPVEEYVREHTGGLGFNVVFDTLGGENLDRSFGAVKRYTGHVVSSLGWGTHSLAPLSFRGATYSGVFTLFPLLEGEGRAAHGRILASAAALASEGALRPVLHGDGYRLGDVDLALKDVERGVPAGKVVVRVA